MIILYLTIISLAYLIALLILIIKIKNHTKKEINIRSLQFDLYKLRDRLLMLAAEEKVKKNRPCFKFLYSLINESIGNIKEFTFKNLLSSAKNVDKEMNKKISKIVREIFNENKELKIISIEYLDVIIRSLITFSPISIRFPYKLRKKIFPKGFNSNKYTKKTRHFIKKHSDSY